MCYLYKSDANSLCLNYERSAEDCNNKNFLKEMHNGTEILSFL